MPKKRVGAGLTGSSCHGARGQQHGAARRLVGDVLLHPDEEVVSLLLPCQHSPLRAALKVQKPLWACWMDVSPNRWGSCFV